MTGNAFTPRKDTTTADRYSMKLSPEDCVKVKRGEPWSAVVTDTETQQQYSVRGAACSIATCFCDAIAEPAGVAPGVDVYHTMVAIGLGYDLPEEPGKLFEALRDHKADVECAMTLLKLDGVELEYVDYDNGLYLLTFETTDAHLAKRHDFDEVLRAGAKDFEPAPWAVKS